MQLHKLKGKKFQDEKELQALIQDNLEEVFGLDFLAPEFQTGDCRFDTLAYDAKKNTFVIIEYKNKEDDRSVGQVQQYRRTVLDNRSDCIEEYNDNHRGHPIRRKDVDWDALRILLISPVFSRRQMSALLDPDTPPVELWKARYFEDGSISLNRLKSLENTGSGDSVFLRSSVVESVKPKKEINHQGVKPGFHGFTVIGIQKGDELTLKGRPDITCKVIDDKHVSYRGERMSLSGAAKRAKEPLGWAGKSINGAQYWMFRGKSINDLCRGREKVSPKESSKQLIQPAPKPSPSKNKKTFPKSSRNMRKGFNGFTEIRIASGEVLTLKGRPDITCAVVDDTHVLYQGEVMSLSGAAKRAREPLGRSGQVSGPAHWMYRGKLIQDMCQSQEKASLKASMSPKEKQHVGKLDSSLQAMWFELRGKLSRLAGADFNFEPSRYANFLKEGKVVCRIYFRKKKLEIAIHRGEQRNGRRSPGFFTIDDPERICRERTHGAKGLQYICPISDTKDLNYMVGLIKQKRDQV